MNLNNIVRNFNNNVTKSQMVKGRNVLKKNLVLSIDEEVESTLGLRRVMSEVKSEKKDDIYLSNFDIDIDSLKVVKTECECQDHYNHCFYKEDYFCKHLIAAFLAYVDKLKEEEGGTYKNGDLGEELLAHIQKVNKVRDHLKLQISIVSEENILKNYFKISFKIGKDKFYSLKDIKEFINIRSKGGTIIYGKDVEYSRENYAFTKEDEKIIDYIKEILNIEELFVDNLNNEGLVNKKFLSLSEKSLRRFLKLCIGRDIDFNGSNLKVVKEELDFKLIIAKNEDGDFELSGEGEAPLFISKDKDVYVFEEKIVLPPKIQIIEIGRFYEGLVSKERIKFKKEIGNRVFNELLPNLEKSIRGNVIIDESVGAIKREELKCEFYCDTQNREAFIRVKLIYGENSTSFFSEDNENLIIRDGKKEEVILEKLEELGLVVKGERFVFKDEEELYNFLIKGFKELAHLGEVFYSEKFKNRKIHSTPKINSVISKSDDGILKFSFNIEGIDKEEYEKILKAFRDNRRFFKLKDNSFLSLESKEVTEFFNILDTIAMDESNLGDISIEKSRAFLIGDILERSSLKDIRGVSYLQEIRDKLLEFKNKEFSVPSGINATLREYQILGFNWFKSLSYLEFGGILADEMGLGKTLQTITFIQSEKGKKSLIITPTSLLYNWEKEFLKFSTGLNIAIVHGSKSERVEILKRYSEYDVIITTYGTLRNDNEEYSKIGFDYCIIDEAQNIKNPLSQNSKAVKNINANVRFALTGTPIENNLLELWSIFDFIMPSYLYGSAVFKKRFVEDEDGSKNLQKYISPFLLRRLKKDVILELPDKIEKKFYVELTKEQKKLYSSYVNKVKEEVKAEGFDGNKITIFSYLTKLRQLCLEPSILVEDYKGGNAKLEASLDIIKESVQGGHKILVFSQFTTVLASISKELKNENIEHYYLDGSTKASKRMELVDSFNEDREKKVFLISLKAGGTGLNLTSADIVIHFDPWWNPAIENQATDRAHRIGQKNVVEVFKLIAEGTIEERILALQERKKELINSVIREDATSENILKTLSVDDLLDLFQ